jgi:hypothetical protein
VDEHPPSAAELVLALSSRDSDCGEIAMGEEAILRFGQGAERSADLQSHEYKDDTSLLVSPAAKLRQQTVHVLVY